MQVFTVRREDVSFRDIKIKIPDRIEARVFG